MIFNNLQDPIYNVSLPGHLLTYSIKEISPSGPLSQDDK